jgi:hypothetical protein
MPQFFGPDQLLFGDRIPPALLHDKSLWLELLPALNDGTNAGRHIPNHLQHDVDLVDAQQRCPAARWKTFRECYAELLPPELQRRFARHLVAALRAATRWSSGSCPLLIGLAFSCCTRTRGRSSLSHTPDHFVGTAVSGPGVELGAMYANDPIHNES